MASSAGSGLDSQKPAASSAVQHIQSVPLSVVVLALSILSRNLRVEQ
jgi:hypothetical protein